MHSDTSIVGFVDDDPALRGRSVRGVRVLGNTDDLERDLRTHDDRPDPDRAAERVARGHAGDRRTRARDRRAGEGPAPCDGRRSAGRCCAASATSTSPTCSAASTRRSTRTRSPDYLEGATVLVTGAGGSIGSEIARQVARFKPGAAPAPRPRREPAARDGQSTTSPTPSRSSPTSATGRDCGRSSSATDPTSSSTRPRTSTCRSSSVTRSKRRTRTCSARGGSRGSRPSSGAGGFVHISTDKAADPCFGHGCDEARGRARRVPSRQASTSSPSSAVRFGNVLGSRGSVVPTFLRQILEGGPVTVTDPEMTRYFMTIPEAVSLVLQAGAMADAGKVFLLDMGKPVSIIELARQMIRLVRTPARRGRRDRDHRHAGRASGSTSSCTTTPRSSNRRGTRRSGAFSRTSTPDPPTLFFFLELLASEVRGDVRRSAGRRRCSRSCSGDAASTCQLDSSKCRAHDEPVADASHAPTRPTRRARRATPARRTAATERPARQAAGAARRAGRRSRPRLPFARPARPPLERVVAPAEALVRLRHAHQRPARRPSSRTASPNGSASRTSSRSVRARPA